MKLQKRKVKNFIAFLVFCFLIWEVFIHCTYLFRDTYRAGRQNIIGFYDEKEDSLDVVVIGASCVYRYWDCMHAWKSCGITSYDYSVGSMSPAATIFAIKDIQKRQNPQLIIFDVRKILSRFPDTIGGIWGTIDAQDYNTNRLAAVEYYCRLNGVALKDAWAEIVDIITYHNNHAALASELSWQLWDNRIDESLDKEGFYKGFAIAPDHAFATPPAYDALTEETMALDEQLETVYIDILEYCNTNNVPLLLVASPFVVTREDMAQFNRMEEIAQEYEIPFLNTNKYYEEMGLNFSTDFYDIDHVNIYGADKYTDFLLEYITKNYEFSNHANDLLNSAWESVYEKYDLEAKEAYQELQQTIDDKYRAFEIEQTMRKTNQAYSWLSMADNSNITVLILMCQPCDNAPSLESRSYLERYGMLFGEEDCYSYMARFSDEVLYGSHTDTEHAGQLGETDKFDYFLSIEGEPQLMIGEKNYFGDSLSGIRMAAFDNNTNEVVDVVNIDILEDGSLTMEHYEIGGSF